MARILFVDDEETIRYILSRRFTQWGHDVVTAHGAEAALEAMHAQPADIVFSDVIMPVYDGVWLVQQIRERWPHTVIVAVSGAQDAAYAVDLHDDLGEGRQDERQRRVHSGELGPYDGRGAVEEAQDDGGGVAVRYGTGARERQPQHR